MNQLVVPSNGLKLIDGSIVMIARFPDTKWIVHYGWYSFNNQQSMGWYFCSIPKKTILPVNNDDLNSLIVISSEDQCCHCPPQPVYPPHPCPPGHAPEKFERFTQNLKNELDAAFISVDTIADRNSLQDNDRKLPNGKLVRVNYIDDFDGPKYFRWDANNQVWKEESFGVDENKYATKEELQKEVAKQIDEADIPKQIESIVKDSEVIKETVSSQVDRLVPIEVEKATVQIKQELTKLSSDLEWEQLT